MNPILESAIASTGIPLPIFLIAIIWSLIWKALALWKSARKGSHIWFVLFFIVHTLGIMEILYLFLFSEISLDKKKIKKSRR